MRCLVYLQSFSKPFPRTYYLMVLSYVCSLWDTFKLNWFHNEGNADWNILLQALQLTYSCFSQLSVSPLSDFFLLLQSINIHLIIFSTFTSARFHLYTIHYYSSQWHCSGRTVICKTSHFWQEDDLCDEKSHSILPQNVRSERQKIN